MDSSFVCVAWAGLSWTAPLFRPYAQHLSLSPSFSPFSALYSNGFDIRIQVNLHLLIHIHTHTPTQPAHGTQASAHTRISSPSSLRLFPPFLPVPTWDICGGGVGWDSRPCHGLWWGVRAGCGC